MDKWLNKVFCDDCLNILRQIPGGCIDLVLTDPPYMVSSEVVIRRQRNPVKYKYRGKDISLNFGPWDVFPSLEAYLEFSKKWFTEAVRVLRRGGHLVSFWDKHKMTYMTDWAKELNVKPRQCLFYIKTNACPQARKVSFMSAVEAAFWGTKETTERKYATFNYQLGQHPDYFMHSIVGYKTKKDGVRSHPCQKPIAFGEWIIGYLSNEGDIVLDPFCGTGAFLIAAYNLNRRYIGIDISKNYVERAIERLEHAKRQIKLQIR